MKTHRVKKTKRQKEKREAQAEIRKGGTKAKKNGERCVDERTERRKGGRAERSANNDGEWEGVEG